MSEVTRNNHYVPVWYQKRFFSLPQERLWYLDLDPATEDGVHEGGLLPHNAVMEKHPKKCFCEVDLYTTFPLGAPNDEIEKHLFGKIDDVGARAVRALVENDLDKMHKTFASFFEYLDAQKIRTPKGLAWIKSNYSGLTHVQLLIEMQKIRTMHCTMWAESVLEIVSTREDSVGFIVTDHPVTIYNSRCPPSSSLSGDFRDPDISLKGSQTIFPLDSLHCAVFTNLEYAQNPSRTDLLSPRTNARSFDAPIVRYDNLIRGRLLNPDDVVAINYILKSRAKKYLAAKKQDWLFPEKYVSKKWEHVGDVLLPPKNKLWGYGGEMYIGYTDGRVDYRDAYGRVSKVDHLKKEISEEKLGANSECLCGSGRKYRRCCYGRGPGLRPIVTELSIRERNLVYGHIVSHILGLDKGRQWSDVRKSITDKEVVDIHEAFSCGWPKDSNILGLLPKPNRKVLRAIYVGSMEPAVALRNIISMAPYFDEIIVLNPFVNTECVNPKFSPVNKPDMFKQETLSNLFLFLQLFKYVDAGVVNLIPDPCLFLHGLRKEVYESVVGRAQRMRKGGANSEEIRKALLKSHLQFLGRLPEDALEKHIRTHSPGISSHGVSLIVEYVKGRQEKDPSGLLQMVPPGDASEMISTQRMPMTLELALFLAQFTGAVICTDSMERWQEIQSQWGRGTCPQLTKGFEKVKLGVCGSVNDSMKIYRNKAFIRHRGIFKKVISVLQKKDSNDSVLYEQLSSRLIKSLFKVNQNYRKYGGERKFFFLKQYYYRQITGLVPKNGINLLSVQRMLVSQGSSQHWSSVPMAIFMEELTGAPSLF